MLSPPLALSPTPEVEPLSQRLSTVSHKNENFSVARQSGTGDSGGRTAGSSEPVWSRCNETDPTQMLTLQCVPMNQIKFKVTLEMT